VDKKNGIKRQRTHQRSFQYITQPIHGLIRNHHREWNELFKNEYEPTMPMMFMIASGALLSSGSIFAGMPGIPYALIIFTAIGITGLFTSLYLGNKR